MGKYHLKNEVHKLVNFLYLFCGIFYQKKFSQKYSFHFSFIYLPDSIFWKNLIILGNNFGHSPFF